MPGRQFQRNKRTEAYATVVAGTSCTAVINVAPGPSWEVKQISVSAVGASTLPACATYVGTNTAGVFISSTITGNSDTDSTPNTTVRTGESLCAVWTNASIGTVCKITVVYDEVDY